MDRSTAFALVGAVLAGYLSYTVGAVGPYLQVQLGLSDTEVGLHSTALAAGLVVAGTVVVGVARRFGEQAVRSVALLSVLVALPLLGGAVALSSTLAAAFLAGFGLGTVLGYTNATLGRPGGSLARMRLAWGGVWGLLGAFIGPALIAAGAASGIGWWLGLVPAVVLLAVLGVELVLTRPTSDITAPDVPAAPLPRSFWLAWLFCVAGVGVEFGVVFWAAPLVQRRAGVTLPEATAIATLFIVGMLVGRVGLGLGLGARLSLRTAVRGGVVVTAVGAGIAWLATAAPVAGLGLFVTGLGVAVLYPLGAAASLATAPGRPAVAGSRLTSASGVAILLAPFILGAIADRTGVGVGWSVVLVLAAVAFGLSFGLEAGPPRSTDGALPGTRPAPG